MLTVLLISIEHSKPIKDLPDLVAGRAWTIDGVEEVTAILLINRDRVPPTQPEVQSQPKS